MGGVKCPHGSAACWVQQGISYRAWEEGLAPCQAESAGIPDRPVELYPGYRHFMNVDTCSYWVHSSSAWM